MALVEIEYKVSVVVQVDTDARQVLSVRVDDEGTIGASPIDIYGTNEDGTRVEAGDDEAEKAQKIVAEAEWPAWEFGW